LPQKLKTLSKNKIIQLKPYLDELVEQTEQPEYIHDDPVQFMHAFESKNDRELAGFFAAVMAWGRRDIVNAKMEDLLKRMDFQLEVFIGNFSEADALRLDGFKHRTFKPVDIYGLIRCLQQVLQQYQTFERFWKHCYDLSKSEERELMAVFNEQFLSLYPELAARTHKHISNPEKNSSCKRLYMYLRWCIRTGSSVDPGTMSFMPPAELRLPLDVHVARQARKLGLLSRRQNDWKSVLELTERLKILDPKDPARYDFALFGLGVLGEQVPHDMVLNRIQ